MPLLTTPPYPSYAGNMATIGASAARALQLAFGTNDMPVTATWQQSGGRPTSRTHFAGFWEVAEEQTESRIYGGIHYRFDHVAGQQIGTLGGRVRVRQLHDARAPSLGRLTGLTAAKGLESACAGPSAPVEETTMTTTESVESQAVVQDLKGRIRGPAPAARRSGLRRGAFGVERDDRSASGADRPLPRRLPMSSPCVNAARDARRSAVDQGRRPQHRRAGRLRRWADDRHVADARRAGSIRRARVARAQAGCLLGDVDARDRRVHGLAAVLGFVSATGCAGLTLGGGFGYLTRRFGWTTDNLASVDLVTADGRVVRASEQENSRSVLGPVRRRRQLRRRHELRIQAAAGRSAMSSPARSPGAAKRRPASSTSIDPS